MYTAQNAQITTAIPNNKKILFFFLPTVSHAWFSSMKCDS